MAMGFRLVRFKDLAELLEVDKTDICDVLKKYDKLGNGIFARDLWAIIRAGAELGSDAIADIEQRHINATAKRRKPIYAKQRERIIERDKNHCRYCGKRLNKNNRVIDHVIPWSRGGRNGDDNLVLACERCNMKKRDFSLIEAGMELLPIPE